MDIDVSVNIRKQAKSYKLKPEILACADLIACGWSIADAWAAAVRKGATWTKKALQEEWDRLQDNENFQARIADTKEQMKQRQVERIQQQIAEETDKDEEELFEKATNKRTMIIDLQRTLERLTPGSADWLKTKQLIVDVTRMKQEETKKEDDTRHYYLPVNYPTSCQNCLLNPALKKKVSKKVEEYE